MSVPESLSAFVASTDGRERSLAVVNSRQPAPVQRLLESAFEGQSVDVAEREILDEAPDGVYLLEDDDEVVARSSLQSLMESFLLVNGDLYRTGTSGLDRYEAPDVLTGLTDTRFRMRGFPESNKEKLLLIVISRYIERLAFRAGAGTLRSSFQRLSRIEDEQGTRRVYERIADTDVDVHVYGVPDSTPDDLGVTVHAGTDQEYRRSWFVVYTPPDDGNDGEDPAAPAADPVTGEHDHAALVCLEVDDNEWDGTWTYDPDRVRTVARYICEGF